MKAQKWDARIERARELEKVYPFAAEGLRFYGEIARAQKAIYVELVAEFGKGKKRRETGELRGELDLFFLLPRFSGFLATMERSAPGGLAQAVREMRARDGNWARGLLQRFWEAGPHVEAALAPEEMVTSWAFLAPYAEYLADTNEIEELHETPSLCPLCGGKPIVGVLRQEGDGAKKSLICMLCSHEWNFRRIYCPACGEEREPQMGFYTAPELAHVRVDVCDTCHTYMKTVDLTKVGLAVPIVDELAAMPLDLWAREHGYNKLQMNLVGM
jgi:formate dehydrogenase accessory protein FdhE